MPTTLLGAGSPGLGLTRGVTGLGALIVICRSDVPGCWRAPTGRGVIVDYSLQVRQQLRHALDFVDNRPVMELSEEIAQVLECAGAGLGEFTV